MISEGSRANDFVLYGVEGTERDQYVLSEATSNGKTVVLLFYPFDFSPVCTEELCEMRNAAWFEAVDDVEVWGISSDSTYSHRAFAGQYDLNYPLLSDQRGEVADRYGVKYDWWDGHVDVPQRAVFVISPEMQIEYAWRTYNAYDHPDFAPVKEIVDTLAGLTGADTDDLPTPDRSEVEPIIEPFEMSPSSRK